MPSASALRRQIEAALAERIPSALTPLARAERPVAPTGIASVDQLLEGGLPIGAISELVGPECSGRTSLAYSFLSRRTQEGMVCAWVDVSDAFDPESAAANGVDLRRVLWVRCGVAAGQAPTPAWPDPFKLPEKYLISPQAIKGLHGGGHGPHPRTEIKGLSNAVGGFLRPESPSPSPSQPQPETADPGRPASPNSRPASLFAEPAESRRSAARPKPSPRPWSRIDQALRVTDLLLQAGGFSCLVLDMGSLAPEHASRVPLATWFRYRAAAERSRSSILLLTQHACAKSSASLVLTLQPGQALQDEATVLAGMEYRMEIKRERFPTAPSNVIPLRKPPQSERTAHWLSRAAWASSR